MIHVSYRCKVFFAILLNHTMSCKILLATSTPFPVLSGWFITRFLPRLDDKSAHFLFLSRRYPRAWLAPTFIYASATAETVVVVGATLSHFTAAGRCNLNGGGGGGGVSSAAAPAPAIAANFLDSAAIGRRRRLSPSGAGTERMPPGDGTDCRLSCPGVSAGPGQVRRAGRSLLGGLREM